MILGLDLSLSSTGWATLTRSGGTATGLITPKGDLTERLVDIQVHLLDLLDELVDMVVIEDVPRNARFGGVALGMVHAVCRMAIWHTQTSGRSVWYVPPATLKVLATGKGGAGKDEVLASAIRRLGYTGHSNDCADAAWLCDLGARRLGWDRPALPASHLRALNPPKTTKTTTKRTARQGVTPPAGP